VHGDKKQSEREAALNKFIRRVRTYAGPHTTASFARCTPFLEDFTSRRVLCFSPPRHPSVSIPTHLALRLSTPRLTPLNAFQRRRRSRGPST
jgi:hypothetical protein